MGVSLWCCMGGQVGSRCTRDTGIIAGGCSGGGSSSGKEEAENNWAVTLQ